jgi:transposase
MNKEELLKLEKEELIDYFLTIINAQAMKIAELEAKLNTNSNNSSKPPSSDGLKKQNKKKRSPREKGVGGQPGHEGNGLKLMRAPDKYVTHEPKECAVCPHAEKCRAVREISETRYEIDIKIETVTTAHEQNEVICPKSRRVLRGEFPGHITGSMQYGVNMEALAVSLNTVGMVSINRTHEILSGVFGVPISTGTISNMVSECAKKLEPAVAEIKEALKQEPVVHYDETGTRVEKKTVWAHVASTDKLTYIEVHEKRGREAFNKIGILLMFLGVAIHDCFAPYFSYACRHGLCNAHLLRELTAVFENTQQVWSQKLLDLLLVIKTLKEKMLAEGISAVPPDILEIFDSRYDKIMLEALKCSPIPVKIPGVRKPKRGKTGALVDRLVLRKEQYLLFFADFDVPFDNNQAERDIRMFKVKQKVSGCFRTMQGANDFAVISSYIGTARKQGISGFFAIKNALLGDSICFVTE